MTKFSSRLFAAAAGLCLISTSASAMDLRVSYAGLDLARPDQAQVFSARVERVAGLFCDQHRPATPDLSARRQCRTAVWDEVKAQLPDARREALEQALQPDARLASRSGH